MKINDLYKTSLSGDKSAEEELFKELTERFNQFANHRIWNEQDVAEVVQDSLTIIIREYKDINFETSFSAWAYKVLDNKILSYIKKRQDKYLQAPLTDTAIEDHLVCTNPFPELTIRLLACLRKLNERMSRHARILNLHYQGFKAEEICDKMKINKNTLYIILHRARSSLEKCLETGEIN